jgi:hypothetical protein
VHTHFVEVDEEDSVVDTNELYDLIIYSHGSGVPIRPELITSTDDSVVFTFCQSSTENDEFCLVTKESWLNRGKMLYIMLMSVIT